MKRCTQRERETAILMQKCAWQSGGQGHMSNISVQQTQGHSASRVCKHGSVCMCVLACACPRGHICIAQACLLVCEHAARVCVFYFFEGEK